MTQSRIIIEPGRAGRNYWRDLWRYRELFYFLAWRDILVRYKQTVIGVAWAVLRPLLTMLVLAVIFGAVAKMPTYGVPRLLLIMCGMLPWQLFANSFAESGNSLVANSNLISKIYFPRLIIPSGAIVVGFVDFAISGLLMAALMLWYGFLPDWRVLALPLFVAMLLALSLAAGLLISALTVQYRDFRFIVPFVVQLGMYVSPVGFTSNDFPEKWRLLFRLNPLAGIIDGFRWSLLRGHVDLYLPSVAVSCLVTLGLMLFSVWYFRRTEKTFADII